MFISTDYSQTGSVYLADGKNIYYSGDYGSTFNNYKTLDRNIVGIYKKPDSNILYAATRYDIYEITTDSISVIKHLEPDPGLADYYPLAKGNKWVYREITCMDDPFVECDTTINVVEISGDTTLSNGHKYFIVEGLDTYERFDSSDATIRRYGEDTLFTNHEYIIESLSAEVGDTLCTNRFFPYTFNCEAPKIFERETTANLFGNNYPKKVYQLQYVFWINYSLVKGIGIDSMFTAFDFGYTSSELLGCVIDGVLYGDTTTVGINDEPANIISQFVLFQNYPNPFNPTTKIKYSIPNVETHRDASLQVVLKVYDVLGKEVATLVNEEKQPGVYEVEFQSSVGSRQLASGIYYYQLKAGNFTETKKMVVLK
ncbi:MAG: T9SS C-terminal target domain-containing protein [Ignavibacteriales bacterium]|nr:MAG: T9SS C-terminal target domain-containing protein [Ignavibacteriales bacterium]